MVKTYMIKYVKVAIYDLPDKGPDVNKLEELIMRGSS